MPKPDLETQLTNVDDWVHQEFASIDEMLVGAGCERRETSGPGRAYRASGRIVLHLHPKYHWLGLGFPEELREDVAALTTRLRPQLGAAWINYTPESCDRDTVDLLVDEALRLARSGGDRTSTTDVPTPVAQDLEPASMRDQMDLTLLLDVLRAFKRHELARGEPASVKILREAIYFHWEGPRLPRGRKRSPQLKHSPAAREQRRQGDMSGLVYEHVLPISHVIRGLLADVTERRASTPTCTQGCPRGGHHHQGGGRRHRRGWHARRHSVGRGPLE